MTGPTAKPMPVAIGSTRLKGSVRLNLNGSFGRGAVIAIPTLWLVLFLLVPTLIVLVISFATTRIGIPPFTPLLSWADDGALQIKLFVSNYAFWAKDNIYLEAYFDSVKLALLSTLLCLALGYPMAYAIARAPSGLRTILLMMVVMPFWTSFLIRIYAWIGILKDTGFINQILLGLGVIHEPISMLYTPFSVYLGMVYGYLPFMILPLYSNLEKLDGTLLEAAADLGARPWRSFVSVTWPLSLPGVIAGSLLVFIPACGEYVIPALLGGPDTYMIGTQIANDFFENRDWPQASAVAISLLIFLLAPIVWFERVQARQTGGRTP